MHLPILFVLLLSPVVLGQFAELLCGTQGAHLGIAPGSLCSTDLNIPTSYFKEGFKCSRDLAAAFSAVQNNEPEHIQAERFAGPEADVLNILNFVKTLTTMPQDPATRDLSNGGLSNGANGLSNGGLSNGGLSNGANGLSNDGLSNGANGLSNGGLSNGGNPLAIFWYLLILLMEAEHGGLSNGGLSNGANGLSNGANGLSNGANGLSNGANANGLSNGRGLRDVSTGELNPADLELLLCSCFCEAEVQ